MPFHPTATELGVQVTDSSALQHLTQCGFFVTSGKPSMLYWLRKLNMSINKLIFPLVLHPGHNLAITALCDLLVHTVPQFCGFSPSRLRLFPILPVSTATILTQVLIIPHTDNFS